MTYSEFKQEFLIAYDAVASNKLPGFIDYEISVILTKAQENILKRVYSHKSNLKREGFEGSEKRRKELGSLVVTSILEPARTITDNVIGDPSISEVFSLPDDCFFVVEESVKIKHEDCSTDTYSTIKPITHDFYQANLENPFKKPYSKVLWRLDYNGKHEIIHDGKTEIKEYKIRYIKQPNPIIVSDISPDTINGYSAPQTSPLHEMKHREIIDEAVRLAVSYVKPELIQIPTANINLNE